MSPVALGNIAIIGYSGHAYVVADAAISMGMQLTHYCDINNAKTNPFKLDYLGYEGDNDFEGWQKDYKFILGIGDNQIRYRTAKKLSLYKKQILNVIHPAASCPRLFEIGIGNFIAKQASVNIFAEVGDFCILNTACIIEHECKLGNAVHIAPGAVLAGNVTVGDFSFIGANAVIKQGINIGSNVIIGAGAVVINDVPDNYKIVGNPGRKL